MLAFQNGPKVSRWHWRLRRPSEKCLGLTIGRPVPALALQIGLCIFVVSPGGAETLRDALESAYRLNPTLNAERENVGAIGENLAKAKAGFHPKVSATADIGLYSDSAKPSPEDCNRAYVGETLLSTSSSCAPYKTNSTPRGVGLQANQNLFDGFRTTNAIRQAKSQISGAQAAARNVEQNTLLMATTAYVDVLAGTAIVAATERNVAGLQDQLRQTRQRHAFGDVTKTDVAQIEARLSAAQAQHSLASANRRSDVAAYKRVVGREPSKLAPAQAIDRMVPVTIEETIELALARNPAIEAARQGIDVALLQTKIIRGELLPTVSITGSVIRRYDISSRGDEQIAGSVVGKIAIPLYDGGDVSARSRQSIHVSTQRRLDAEAVRDEIRALAERSWSQYHGAKERIASTQLQVKASAIALSGLRSEWLFGERTLREVLDAQQEVVNARINLVLAQRDLVVSSFTVAQATGRLNLQELENIELTAGHDDIFRFSERRTDLALWPRSKKPGLDTNTSSGCSSDCTGFKEWSLRL